MSTDRRAAWARKPSERVNRVDVGVLDALPGDDPSVPDPAERMFGSSRFPQIDPATYLLNVVAMWDALPGGWPYTPEELQEVTTTARAAARHHLKIGGMVPEYLPWILDNVDYLEITFRHFGHWPHNAEGPHVMVDLQERLRAAFKRRRDVSETRKWRTVFYQYVKTD